MDPEASALAAPLLKLLATSAVVMGSPGPSTVSLTAVGAAFGPRRALSYFWGLVAGTTVVLVGVVAGLVAALTAAPGLRPALTLVGATYMLWLAFRIATAPPLSERDPSARAPRFVGGFALAVANPKAWFSIAAVFAGTTLVAASPGLDAALKMIVLALMIVVIHAAWLLVGASFSRALRDPVRSRIANVLLALALVASTVPALIG